MAFSDCFCVQPISKAQDIGTISLSYIKVLLFGCISKYGVHLIPVKGNKKRVKLSIEMQKPTGI